MRRYYVSSFILIRKQYFKKIFFLLKRNKLFFFIIFFICSFFFGIKPQQLYFRSIYHSLVWYSSLKWHSLTNLCCFKFSYFPWSSYSPTLSACVIKHSRRPQLRRIFAKPPIEAATRSARNISFKDVYAILTAIVQVDLLTHAPIAPHRMCIQFKKEEVAPKNK